LLPELARLAQPEEWNRPGNSAADYRILGSYLVHTFRRAQYQGRVEILRDGRAGDLAAFNTGLRTRNYDRIFGLFVPQTRKERHQPWYLHGFYLKGNYRLERFEKLPEPAEYFNSTRAELVYDPSVPLHVDVDAIARHGAERFPPSLRGDSRRRTEALERAVEQARLQVEENYQRAVPQYYWPSKDPAERGRVQLLLPLCLESSTRVDSALVVDRVGEAYDAVTVMTLMRAYTNARLIARPTQRWLEVGGASGVGPDGLS
jgi:hypothetical protein